MSLRDVLKCRCRQRIVNDRTWVRLFASSVLGIDDDIAIFDDERCGANFSSPYAQQMSCCVLMMYASMFNANEEMMFS